MNIKYLLAVVIMAGFLGSSAQNVISQECKPHKSGQPSPEPSKDQLVYESNETYGFSVKKSSDDSWQFEKCDGNYGIIKLVKTAKDSTESGAESTVVQIAFKGYVDKTIRVGDEDISLLETSVKNLSELFYEVLVTREYTDIAKKKSPAETAKYDFIKKGCEYSFTGTSVKGKDSHDVWEIVAKTQGDYVLHVQIDAPCGKIAENKQDIKNVLKSIDIKKQCRHKSEGGGGGGGGGC